MPTLQALIDSYLAGPRQLRRAVSGMNAEQVKARPVPGKWSTIEVVCHLADFDAIYADRIKRILAEDNPQIYGADEEGYARTLAYQERDLEEELRLLELTRQQLARILGRASPDALQRVGTHHDPDPAEPRTLESYLTAITSHIPHHVQFIPAKRLALGLPANP